MTKVIGWLLGLIFKDDPLCEEEMGWVPFAEDGIEDDEVIFDASQEEPDRELYDDHYPWSRR